MLTSPFSRKKAKKPELKEALHSSKSFYDVVVPMFAV
jgi:hypothetical protein